MRSFKAASLILSPSWMSMARLTFPSRLELNRPEGSCNAAPLAKVILTAFLYVSPVQTMPPWEKTGVPGDVAFTHFHSSTISGSASCMIARTFASVFPRQSPSSLIFWSIDAEAITAEADSIAVSCTDATLAPNLAPLSVRCNLRPCRDGRPRPSRRAKRGAVAMLTTAPSPIYPPSRLRRSLPRFAAYHLAVYQEAVLNEEDGMKSPCAVNLHNPVTVSQQRLGKPCGPA